MSEKVIPLRERSSFKDVCGLAERLRTEIAAMSNVYADDLAGYIVLAVDSKGCWTLGFKIIDDENCPVGVAMLAGLGISAIQREMIADGAACDAMVRNGLLRPPEEKT